MSVGPDDRRWIAIAAFGALLGAVVAYAAVQFVASLTFAVFLYYAVRPIFHRLDGLPENRRLRAALVLLLFALPFVALTVYAGALVVAEAQAVASRHATDGTLATVAELAGARLPELSVDGLRSSYSSGQVGPLVEAAVGQLSGVVSFLGNFLVRLGLVFVVAYYMLADGHRLTAWFLDEYDHDGAIERYARAADDDISVILFGNILNALMTSIIAVIVYLLYNLVAPAPAEVPFPALVGALTGIGSLIPVVGMKVVYYPVAALMAVTTWLAGATGALIFVAGFVVLSFVVVDLVPDLVLRPFVTGGDTHVGLLMVTYIVGPFVFGFYGLFLAPILLVLTVNFVRILVPALLDRDLPSADEREESEPDGGPA